MSEPGRPQGRSPAADAGPERPRTGRGRLTAEAERLAAARNGVPWKRWGPYLAERAWGTPREDYSADGDPWASFTHAESAWRAYRWGEDGIAGLCDDEQRLCLALTLWNGRDPILKERLFGLTNPQGNHGEDAKELWFHLDALPTSALLRYAYLYPQDEFPYRELVEANGRRTALEPEFELLDTGILDGDRVFDVEVTYAKETPEALVMVVRATNRGPQAASLHLLPTIWFRNTWSWGGGDPTVERPSMRLAGKQVVAEHTTLGRYRIAARATGSAVQWLFTENESGTVPADAPAERPFAKDAFHRFLVRREKAAVNPARRGTKAAAHARWEIPPGASVELTLALTRDSSAIRPADLIDRAPDLIAARQREADEFYDALAHPTMSADERRIQRRALAGLLWSLQYYEFDVARWRAGDDVPPPPGRATSRNAGWDHVRAHDVLAMPDTWEYPWFAAWDLAFHAVTLGLVDPDRAKEQLLALLEDRYLHPDGQVPAYEWEFSDLNPPVQAWAALRVYRRDALVTGQPDRAFLERMLHGLMLAFGWWVNRQDRSGENVFEGGFLGLDNISVIDRSALPPSEGSLEQADATGWMAFFALGLTEMALELALEEPVYVELARHFLGRFVAIGDALSRVGGEGLWDDEASFFFDRLRRPDGSDVPLRAFSIVGLVPLFAARVMEPALLAALPDFARHLEALVQAHPNFFGPCTCFLWPNPEGRRLLALVDEHRLVPVLERVLDETRFLSPYGVRSLSRRHAEAELPVDVDLGGMRIRVRYEPGEAETRIKGGNSNWRGPIWFPINYLLIQALRQFGRYYGQDVRCALPAPYGQLSHLGEVADDVARRLIALYLPDASGARPAFGGDARWRDKPWLRDRLLFFEHFHAEDGRGLGASHQTGWTALISNVIDELHRPGRSRPSYVGADEPADLSRAARARSRRDRGSSARRP